MSLLITVIFLSLALLLAWGYCGYFAFLCWRIRVRQSVDAANEMRATSEQGRIVVLIPCRNEAAFVERKVNNLLVLDRGDLDVEYVFLDGGSTDSTVRDILKRIESKPHFAVVQTDQKGKIPQINFGLKRCANGADIIVNTDMDALLESNVIQEIVSVFHADSRVGVVGAMIVPSRTMALEEAFWEDQNLIRLLESEAHSASTVVAPCYAFRASLIHAFPDDCIADDVYVSFLANSEGYTTKYVARARGTELRTPQTLADFLKHKFRKGHANVVETLRFMRHVGQMGWSWRIAFLTRALQLMVLPWGVTLFVLLSVLLALYVNPGLVLFVDVAMCCATLAAMLLYRHTIRQYSWSACADGRRRAHPGLFILNGLISTGILMLIGVSHKFYKQTSCYARLNDRG